MTAGIKALETKFDNLSNSLRGELNEVKKAIDKLNENFRDSPISKALAAAKKVRQSKSIDLKELLKSNKTDEKVILELAEYLGLDTNEYSKYKNKKYTMQESVIEACMNPKSIYNTILGRDYSQTIEERWNSLITFVKESRKNGSEIFKLSIRDKYGFIHDWRFRNQGIKFY